MKTLIGAAVAALLAFPAFAQDPAPSRMKTEPPAPQEQRTNVETKGDAMTTGQISASALLDETVMNEANESIGDVNDVLLDTDGKIASVIVGVGGFLGMGEKDVALSFDNLKFAKDNDNDLVVTTNVTKETLQATPAYTKPNQ
jgi:sporulation protein YlmC with PRC-barrel domain